MAKKLIPYALVIIAFVLGWLISPGDKVDSESFKQEREGYERQIVDLKAKVAAQDSISEAIRQKMIQDSTVAATALKRKEITISSLQKKIRETDYRNYPAAALDSVRAEILRAR